jgi:hypothetical protein
MCTGVEITAALAAAAPYIAATSAAVGTGATIYGASQQSAAQSRAADLVRQQNQADTTAQNQAFTQRIAATRDQSNAQFANNQRQFQDQTTNAAEMRAAQEAALQRQNDTINQENQSAEGIRRQADQRAQDLLQATSGPVQDQSQKDYQDQQAALLAAAQAPGPTGPAATDPSGSGASTSTNDPVMKTALARRMGIAAANVRQYGADIARVGSYGAPLQATGLAIAENQGGIMPAESAARLLSAGSGVRLLPSQIAYRGATDQGTAADAMIRENAAQQNQLAGLGYSNATAGANLFQSDATTAAANKAAQAKADAAWQSQLGGLFSGIGNLAGYGAGLFGPNIMGKIVGTPTVPTVNQPVPGTANGS